MAKNRNLAGLAALGALGYMMTRGGEKKDISVDNRGTMPSTPARLEDDRDVGMISGANPAGLYRNTESGELFSMNRPEETVLKQRPVVATPGGRVSTARSMTSAAAEIPMEVPSRGRREMLKNPQRGPAASDLEGMRAERATNDRLNELTREMNRGQRGKIAATGYQNPQRGPSFEEIQEKNAQDRMDALRASGGMRAKGGAIKMASGGSTSSASRRADGIAQRGKTRGRMR